MSKTGYVQNLAFVDGLDVEEKYALASHCIQLGDRTEGEKYRKKLIEVFLQLLVLILSVYKLAEQLPNLANHTPSFKPPLLYWCIQREVYRLLSGGSILSIKFSRYSVIKTNSTYSLPLL